MRGANEIKLYEERATVVVLCIEMSYVKRVTDRPTIQCVCVGGSIDGRERQTEGNGSAVPLQQRK